MPTNYFKLHILSLCFLALSTMIFTNLPAEYPPESQSTAIAASPWQEAVEYAKKHLPAEGRLVRKSDGFVYLKVDDAYIHTLFPMLGLKQNGYREPPYFRTSSSPGAHISVFYEDEHVNPQELGKTFHFVLKNIIIVNASRHSSYAILQVESPELEKLRVKYGVSPKLKGHEFHISLAKKIHP